MKRISIHDIAKEAGCSASTVSRALKDSDQISPGKRRAIAKIARALGYVPDPVLSQLAINRWGTTSSTPGSTLAYLCNYDKDSKAHNRLNTMREAMRTAASLGYHMEQVNLWGQKSPQSVERILKARGINGVLIGYVNSAIPDLSKVNWNDYTVVSAGANLYSAPAFHSVRASPFEQIMQAGKEVFDNGYRSVGMVLIFHHEGFMEDRYRYGAYHVLKEEAESKGCTLPLLILRHGAPMPEHIEQTVGWYRKHRPEAIIGFNAHIYWLLNIYAKASIPDDVAFCTLHGDTEPFITGLQGTDGAEGIHATHLLDILLRSKVRGIPEHPILHRVTHKWREGTTLPSIKEVAPRH